MVESILDPLLSERIFLQFGLPPNMPSPLAHRRRNGLRLTTVAQKKRLLNLYKASMLHTKSQFYTYVTLLVSKPTIRVRTQ